MKKYELYPLPHDLKSLLNLARAQGWEYSKTTGGHHRLINPEGKIATHSGTPSDYRGIKNFRADLKRMGLRPHPPIKEQKQVTEPKVVVSKVPGDSMQAIPPVGSKRVKPAGRGELMTAIISALQLCDKPEGVTAHEILSKLKDKFPKQDVNSINTSLSYYAKHKKIDRISLGHYRAKTSAEPKEEDDMRVLEEALVVLAKLERVVKRLGVRTQQLEQAKTLLNSIK